MDSLGKLRESKNLWRQVLKNHIDRLISCEDHLTNTKMIDTIALIREVTTARFEAEEIMDEFFREE